MKQLFKVRPEFTEVDPQRILVNIGALLDVPTGKWVKGIQGENILNGGLSLLTGMVGGGNTFKSTMLHYMVLSAASKVGESGIAPYINTYDTEMNIDIDRLNHFSQTFEVFKGIDLHHQGMWSVTDKTLHLGNDWYDILKKYLREEKLKNAKTYTVDTPFKDKDGKMIRTLLPTFGEIDSFSEFETKDVYEMSEKNEIGDSGANTLHMRAGLAKTRLLMELPSLCNLTGHYVGMSAHVGETNAIGQASHLPPPKEMQHMRQGEKIKGVAPKFKFLPNTVWQTVSARNFYNQTTKGPEFPITQDRPDPGSTDLNLVTLKILRSKHGASGSTVPLLVSQNDGVLPSESEFYYIKDDRKRYGLEGNNTTYNLVIYPEVKIMRTTIRTLIREDAKLRRALNITAELAQIQQFHNNIELEIPPIQDLYKKLEEEYGWDMILQTRGYWLFNQYEHEVPFISSFDLIEMYHGLYRPYFLPEGWKKGDPFSNGKGGKKK